VKFHLNRFLRRVRIHGGEFDTSARAMYREGVTSSLRAELRIVRGSTIERKQMSTKTTFKRIALVTVAALGFGVLTTVPSQAVVSIDTLTLSSPTAAQNTAETYTATSAVVTLSFAGAVADSMSVTASVTGNTSTQLAQPYLRLVETSSAVVGDTLTGTSGTPVALNTVTAVNTAVNVNASSDTVRTVAKFAVYLGLGNATTAPTAAGVYTIKLTPANRTAGGPLNATAQTLTITVTAAPTLDPVATTATSIITTATDTSSATDVAVTAIKTAGTAANTKRAVIKVSPLNAAGTAATDSYTAIIKSGPGLLGVVLDGNKDDLANDVALGRVVNAQSNAWIAVYSDGAAGVSTIEIQSKAGVVLATETLTFYGAATRMTAKAIAPVIAASGSTDAILVNIYDGDIEIKDATTFYENSDKTTVIAGTYAVNSSVTYNTTEGGFVIPVTAVAAGTANITITTNSAATVTTGITSNAVALRVGGTVLDDVKVAFDKASYLPGELATITVTPVDKDGLVLSSTRTTDTYTVFATGGIVAPVALGANSATITGTAAHDGGVAGAGLGTDGVASYKIYMPSYQGTFVFKYTTGTMATTAKSAVARTISVDVIAADGGAAAAAAEEATAAAQDATDAALSAAEAAEAATAMAQEAVDAVAELSASVTKLISALRAQITTLTNLVVKIQKKVRA
jgi:trimeric autotransporter adhesin